MFAAEKKTPKRLVNFGRWLAWPGSKSFPLVITHGGKPRTLEWTDYTTLERKHIPYNNIYIIFMYTCILYIYSNPKKVFPGGLQLFSLRREMLYNGLHIWNSIICDFICLDGDFVVLCFSDSPHLNFWGLWSHVWMDSGHDKQRCTFYLRWVTRGFALLYPPVWESTGNTCCFGLRTSTFWVRPRALQMFTANIPAKPLVFEWIHGDFPWPGLRKTAGYCA